MNELSIDLIGRRVGQRGGVGEISPYCHLNLKKEEFVVNEFLFLVFFGYGRQRTSLVARLEG